MVYNEQKLASFTATAFKYELQKIVDTHQAIRDALDKYYDRTAVKEKYGLGDTPVLDIYLQGSYKNSTNVTKSSDVDLVVQMQTIWRSNNESFPADQLAKYDASFVNVSYSFEAFNLDILNALQQYFRVEYVNNGNKCLQLKEHGKYCFADITTCFTYREYGFFETVQNQNFTEGMYFITNEGKFVRNFPKQHYEALVAKSQNTNGIFKETVRMFKNIRDDLVDKGVINEGTAKSYFIENLLYRVPLQHFTVPKTLTERFKTILEYLVLMYNTLQIQQFKCANGIDLLISDNNWKLENVQQFLIALIKVKDETEL